MVKKGKKARIFLMVLTEKALIVAWKKKISVAVLLFFFFFFHFFFLRHFEIFLNVVLQQLQLQL